MPKYYDGKCKNCSLQFTRKRSRDYCCRRCGLLYAHRVKKWGFEKGSKLSEEKRLILSIRVKREWEMGMRKGGWKLTEESKKRQSLVMSGRKVSDEFREKMRGIAMQRVIKGTHNFWKGGLSSVKQNFINSFEYKNWRKSIYELYDWTCQKCKLKGGNLNVHHIKNFSEHPELRMSNENATVMCFKCHKTFHNKYGQRKNNLQQLNEYIYGK